MSEVREGSRELLVRTGKAEPDGLLLPIGKTARRSWNHPLRV